MTGHLALAAAAIAFLAGAAHAQGRPQPDDPAAPAAPVAYDSAFAGYQPFRDEPLAPWREVNDTARVIGGHVGVMRAEQQGAARPAAATTQTVPPAGAMPPGMHGAKPK